MIIHFDEMQVNRDKGDYIPSDEELAELYDEYEHYERGKAEGRKTGYWIEDSGTIACSECGTHAMWITNNDYGSKPYISNFCPKCGADMRGDKDHA